jgi:hypothetical protein
VDIALQRNGEAVQMVAEGAANTGSLLWNVPEGLALGGGYRIVIDDGAQSVSGGAFSVVLAQPTIGISTRTITFTVNATRSSFQVFNTGPTGTVLNFQVVGNRPWLVVSPRTGSSSSLSDRVSISVEVVGAAMQAGTNNGRITVQAQGDTGVRSVDIDVVAFRPLP